MAAPIGYPLWLWFRSNPMAQGVALAVGVWVAFRLWLWRKIRGERKDAAEDAVEDTIDAIEKETDDAIQRVEDDRRATADLNDEQLRKLAAQSSNNRGRLHRFETD